MAEGGADSGQVLREASPEKWKFSSDLKGQQKLNLEGDDKHLQGNSRCLCHGAGSRWNVPDPEKGFVAAELYPKA